MHVEKYGEAHRPLIKDAFSSVKEKKVLASQRALQFGGKPVIKNNMRIYNCATSYCDRLDFFKEAFFMGLCGVGVGFSFRSDSTWPERCAVSWGVTARLAPAWAERKQKSRTTYWHVPPLAVQRKQVCAYRRVAAD